MKEKIYGRIFFLLPLSLNVVSYQVKDSRFINLRLLTDLTSDWTVIFSYTPPPRPVSLRLRLNNDRNTRFNVTRILADRSIYLLRDEK